MQALRSAILLNVIHVNEHETKMWYYPHANCVFCILFQNISTSLCFRGQRIFLHNANGRFGSVPLEASGDFGIHPEEGEFHLMCQVLLSLFPHSTHSLGQIQFLLCFENWFRLLDLFNFQEVILWWGKHFTRVITKFSCNLQSY